jgi:hypothetical protein
MRRLTMPQIALTAPASIAPQAQRRQMSKLAEDLLSFDKNDAKIRQKCR